MTKKSFMNVPQLHLLIFQEELKSPNLHHIRSDDIWLMAADLIQCKLGDFNQNKTADLTYFVGTIEALAKEIKILLEVVFNVKIFFGAPFSKRPIR